MTIKLDNHDMLLISGILVFLILIRVRGMAWAFESLANFYVAITVFNWLKEKITKEEK